MDTFDPSSTPVPNLSPLMDGDHHHSHKHHKKPNRRILIALLLFFLITLPIIAVFVAQRQQIGDIRKQAAYPGCTCTSTASSICSSGTKTADNTCSSGFSCCNAQGCWTNGQVCTSTPGGCCSGLTCALSPSGGDGICVVPTPSPTPVNVCNVPARDPNSEGFCDRNALNPDGTPYTLDCANVPEGWDCFTRPECGSQPGNCVVIAQSANGECACAAGGGPGPTNTPTPSPTSPPGNPTNPPPTNPPPTNPPPTNTPTPTRTPTPTPTRTPTPRPTNTPTNTPVIGQCLNIKIYRNGVVVNPNTLQPGNVIVIAVVGTNATQARIRINGEATWRVSTTTNTLGEWIFNYTIPTDGTLSFSIVGELFIGGVWQ